MAYKSTGELPDSFRDHLPEKAREVYPDAFNNPWEDYEDMKKRWGTGSHEVVLS